VIEATQRPAIILAPNKTLAAQLYGEFKSFFPDNAVEYFVSYYDYYQPEAYVPRTDTYIEKDSSINEEIDRMRHSATRALLGARRRHHRGLGVLHLRYRLGRNLYRDDLCAEEGRTHRPAAIDRRPRRPAIQAHQADFTRATFRVRATSSTSSVHYGRWRSIRDREYRGSIALTAQRDLRIHRRSTHDSPHLM